MITVVDVGKCGIVVFVTTLSVQLQQQQFD